MTAKLIIRLNHNQTYDWLHTDSNNHPIANAHQQTELKVPANLTNTTITLLIPSTDVSLISVKLPRMKRSQLTRALPYAIEERLCDDIEQLHITAGQWQQENAEEVLMVAVTAQDKMREWLAISDAAGIKLHQIIPDVLALPYLPAQWACAIEQDLMLIRTGQQTGVTVDINNAPFVFNKLLTGQKPNAITVADYTHTNTAKLFSQFAAAEIKINERPQPFLVNAVNSIDNAINLLQGSYKSTAKRFKFASEWRFTLQLAIATLALIIITQIISYMVLTRENAKLQTQISALSQQIMPGAHIDDRAKPRIERELHLLAQLGKGNAFLELINTIGKTLKQTTGITVEQITYQNNLLSVRVNANNQQSMENWLNTLRANKINILRVNPNADNQANTAEVIIKGA